MNKAYDVSNDSGGRGCVASFGYVSKFDDNMTNKIIRQSDTLTCVLLKHITYNERLQGNMLKNDYILICISWPYIPIQNISQ